MKHQKPNDESVIVQLSADALKGLPLGIMQLEADGQIIYVNSIIRELLEIGESEKLSIYDFLDKDNQKIVADNLKNRSKKLKGNDYEFELTLRNGRKLPVQVVAIPAINSEGEFQSSLGIVRSILIPVVSQSVHEVIATNDGLEILENMAKIIQPYLPFDMFSVALYSEDRKSIRSFFTYPPEEGAWRIRWWQIPHIVEKMVNDTETRAIGDISLILDQPGFESLRDSEDTRDFIERGYHSSLRLTLNENQRPIAAISFYSKTINAYDDNDVEFVENVSIRHAVAKALRYEIKREAAFTNELLKDISQLNGDNLEDIAQLICSRVQKHYDWSNVAFFKPNIDDGEFRLLAQESVNERCKAREDYTQPINKGVLSYVFNNRKIVNITNLEKEERWQDTYAPLFKEKVLSELCMPVIVNDSVVLLLNVEDTHVNAISEREEELMSGMLDKVSSAIEHSRLLKTNRQLEVLRDLHYEIAMQTKTPLSIAYSILSRLKSKMSSENIEYVNKGLRQLEKVDLTFDRLAMLGQNLGRKQGIFPYVESKVSLLTVLDDIISILPRMEQEFIYIEKDSSLEKQSPKIKCDLYQLSFCIETILSYFLRMASEEDKIHIHISIEDKHVVLKFKGMVPATHPDGKREYKNMKEVSRMKMDVAIGEDIIRKFIENANGIFYEPKTEGKDIEIAFSLPLL